MYTGSTSKQSSRRARKCSDSRRMASPTGSRSSLCVVLVLSIAAVAILSDGAFAQIGQAEPSAYPSAPDSLEQWIGSFSQKPVGQNLLSKFSASVLGAYPVIQQAAQGALDAYANGDGSASSPSPSVGDESSPPQFGFSDATDKSAPKTPSNLPERSSNVPRPNLVVAKDGSGNFRTVQAAINAAPSFRKSRFTIYIKAGRYTEKLLVPPSKRYLTLRGAGPYRTILAWHDTASTKLKGKPMGTFLSASVAVNADHFSAEDLSFQNTARRPAANSFTSQAVAFRITGDFAAFYNVRFYGYQDTLYCHRGRHFFKNVYVRGSVDFIFGDATAMFLDSLLYADVDRNGGGITAQKRASPKENTGFVFLRCKIQGTGQVFLGRAWGRASRTIFAYTYMDNVVLPVGWNDWADPTRQETIFYGEYKCSGPGSRRGRRAKWSFALTDRQAKPFLSTSFISGSKWLSKTGLVGLKKLGNQHGNIPTNSAIPRR